MDDQELTDAAAERARRIAAPLGEQIRGITEGIEDAARQVAELGETIRRLRASRSRWLLATLFFAGAWITSMGIRVWTITGR